MSDTSSDEKKDGGSGLFGWSTSITGAVLTGTALLTHTPFEGGLAFLGITTGYIGLSTLYNSRRNNRKEKKYVLEDSKVKPADTNKLGLMDVQRSISKPAVNSRANNKVKVG